MQGTLSWAVASNLLLAAGLSRGEHAHVERCLLMASDACWECSAALQRTQGPGLQICQSQT